MKRLSLLLALVLSVPAVAQNAKPSSADPGVSANRAVWQQLSGYVLKSAEDMPDSLYSFKPTPEVRSFGQLIGHVAGAQYMFCAAALGEPNKAEDDIEKSKTTKAELVAAMRASSQYCNRAYAQSDESAAKRIKLFGQDQTRMWALALNAAHDGEHYGNIVTYLRIKGMVPPSSRPTP